MTNFTESLKRLFKKEPENKGGYGRKFKYGNDTMKDFAEKCVMYQNLNSMEALKYIKPSFNPSTANSYFCVIKNYLQKGVKSRTVKRLYDFVDEAIQKGVKPIEVSNNTITNNVNVKNNSDLLIRYGVVLDDKIQIFEDKKEAKTFLKGLTFNRSDINAYAVRIAIEGI